MHLILLPGNSKSNKTWIEEIRVVLSPSFKTSKSMEYRHWEDDEYSMIDLDHELDNLQLLTRDFDGDYVIFAKSAGALLALKGIYEKKINPVKCIFVGTAVLWALSRQAPVEVWLTGYSTPTLFIQHSLDKAMYFEELKRFLELANVQNSKLVELHGASHHYPEIEKLKELTLDFLVT